MPLAFALAAAATPSIGAAPEYELVFEDEFFGGALDTSAWSVEIDCLGGGNLERQCYTDAPANVRVVPFAEGDDAGRDHLAGDGYLELRALVDSTRYAEPAALADCTAAVQIDDGYTKAYLRRGIAHRRLSQHAQALKDLDVVLVTKVTEGLECCQHPRLPPSGPRLCCTRHLRR